MPARHRRRDVAVPMTVAPAATQQVGNPGSDTALEAPVTSATSPGQGKEFGRLVSSEFVRSDVARIITMCDCVARPA